MANCTKLAFLAVAILLLQASWCALSDVQHKAVMAFTSFEQGQDGIGPAACDGMYHFDGELLAALSTQWYAGGSRCFKKILIWSPVTEASVVALVVDECDSQSGCKDDMVATSKAVWAALGLSTDAGEAPIFWAGDAE